MNRTEYVRVRLYEIPKEFVAEYYLIPYANNGWIYFEITKGCYGLPQASMLANTLLRTRLNKYGYYKTATTPGLWHHKCRPIMFVLIADNFSTEYVGDNHLKNLRTTLADHFTIMEDLDGKKSGIDLKWNYATNYNQRTCRLSMDGYIFNLLFKFEHEAPTKPQLSPYRHRKIIYGSKEQFAAEEDTSPKLTDVGIKCL